jgi:biopolymer transport protein ExbD
MRIHDEEDDDRPELNVTPLIDCLFFLLTFFIMTSTLQEAEKPREVTHAPQQLLVELPEAIAAHDAADPAAPLVVSVDESGHFFVGYVAVGIEELHRRLREAGAAHRRIRIEGDRRAAFEAIARVIDLCEFEGLRDIAVRTRDEK